MNNVYEITEEEKEALEFYTSRKVCGFFNLKGYECVNKFLRKITKGEPDLIVLFMKNYEEFKDYLSHIEKLFSISFKYGFTHKLPPIIYRGQNGASKLNYESKEDNYGNYFWMADQFFSCSRSEAETRTFSNLETMYIKIKDNYIEKQIIPFIDVNNILGSSQFYGDEKEILIPPFMRLIYYGDKLTGNRVYYYLELTPFIVPQSFEDDLDELTDDDIKRYYDLSKQYSKTDDKEIYEELKGLARKIKNVLHQKLSHMQLQFWNDRYSQDETIHQSEHTLKA